MYRLYNFPPSGNCYKIRLLLTQLEIPFERVNVSVVQQETQLPEFLQKNPNGKVPVLEIESGQFLSSETRQCSLGSVRATFERSNLSCERSLHHCWYCCLCLHPHGTRRWLWFKLISRNSILVWSCAIPITPYHHYRPIQQNPVETTRRNVSTTILRPTRPSIAFISQIKIAT